MNKQGLHCLSTRTGQSFSISKWNALQSHATLQLITATLGSVTLSCENWKMMRLAWISNSDLWHNMTLKRKKVDALNQPSHEPQYHLNSNYLQFLQMLREELIRPATFNHQLLLAVTPHKGVPCLQPQMLQMQHPSPTTTLSPATNSDTCSGDEWSCYCYIQQSLWHCTPYHILYWNPYPWSPHIQRIPQCMGEVLYWPSHLCQCLYPSQSNRHTCIRLLYPSHMPNHGCLLQSNGGHWMPVLPGWDNSPVQTGHETAPAPLTSSMPSSCKYLNLTHST